MLRVLLAVLLLVPAQAAHSQSRSLEEIERCVETAFPRSARQEVVLRSRDRVGAVNEMEASMLWSRGDEGRTQALIRFDSPPDVRGSAVLFQEREDGGEDMFMYLPELKRVRRISGRMVSGSMFGTDFSYEEFEHLVGASARAPGRLLPDAELEGRAVHVVRYDRPEGDEGRYAFVVSQVDAESCVPLRLAFHEREGEPAKVMEVDPARVEPVQGRRVPREVVMRDVEGGTRTEIVVEEIEVDVEVAPRTFTTRALARGH